MVPDDVQRTKRRPEHLRCSVVQRSVIRSSEVLSTLQGAVCRSPVLLVTVQGPRQRLNGSPVRPARFVRLGIDTSPERTLSLAFAWQGVKRFSGIRVPFGDPPVNGSVRLNTNASSAPWRKLPPFVIPWNASFAAPVTNGDGSRLFRVRSYLVNVQHR